MAIPISPGVYTKIIDLSTYVQAVPGTIGFVCLISRKGPDNKLTFVGSQQELFDMFGKPNITDYGKQYGQGLYIANNHMTVSYSLYVIRPLPEDATYANLFMYADTTAGVVVASESSCNSVAELDTRLQTVLGTQTPICYFIPYGRGDAYEDLGIRISEHANPEVEGVFVLDLYETQFDGDDVIVESFEVSFDYTALDDSGESIFITDVMEKYSKKLICTVNIDGVAEADNNSFDITEPFVSPDAVHFEEGSEGSLITVNATTGISRIDGSVADQILAQAYSGIIDDSVVDLDNIYFTLVWDPGYPTNVKYAIHSLVKDRKSVV